MKGSEIEEELNNSKKAIKVLGGKILKVDEFTLPNSDIIFPNLIASILVNIY